MKLITIALSVTLAASVMAQGGATTVKGTLMDVSCANPKMSAKEVADHDKDCMQMDDCEKSGYAVITADNQILKLDAKGNAMAKTQIAASAKRKGFTVTVMGAVKDGTIAASSVVLDK